MARMFDRSIENQRHSRGVRTKYFSTVDVVRSITGCWVAISVTFYEILNCNDAPLECSFLVLAVGERYYTCSFVLPRFQERSLIKKLMLS